MGKHIGRKINVFHSDNGGEYTSNPFLQLCRDDDIERHSQLEKHRNKLGWLRG